mgnify:CR=1 FL=1
MLMPGESAAFAVADHQVGATQTAAGGRLVALRQRHVAPGGGCEQIPSEVGEIRMVFLRPPHPNTQNPSADLVATLQLGMVFFTGPLAEIGQLIEQLLDKTGRGELSKAFMTVTGMRV